MTETNNETKGMSPRKAWEQHYRNAVSVLQRFGDRLAAGINRISTNRMAGYAAVLFVLSLIPLLLLGRYNVMCIDDYDYGRQIHDTWLATGSFGQSVMTAIEHTAQFYRQWQGTYVSCFLMSMCPMNFNYECAFVVPIIMIGMFSVSTFFFGRHILTAWLGSDKHRAAFVMLLLLFVFYQVIEAPFEGIYWYNGSTHYVLMQSLLFFLLTAVSGSIVTEQSKKALLWCVLACVDGVIVGGGNLVTGLQAEILLAFLLLYTVAVRREKLKCALLPFLCFSAGFLCNILAPGNAMRASLDTDEGYGALMAVILSFYYAVVFMIKWTVTLVIFLWLALLPVLWQIGKQSKKTFAHPVWVTLGAFCVLSAMFTPTLYAVGMVGLSRVDNIIQMVYYLCLFLVTAYWMGWLAHRKDVSGRSSEKVQRIEEGRRLTGRRLGLFLESTGNLMTACFVCIILLVWVFTADKNTYTSVSALRSLVNGEAKTFYAEAMARHEIYTDEDIVDVELAPYSAKPALFSFDDLSDDPGYWTNLAVTQYYHKAYVKVLPDGQ
jgi:hypothetical protein